MNPLKLDFNERADATPLWYNNFIANTDMLWKYPEKNYLEKQLAKKFNIECSNVFVSNGGDESIELLFKMSKLKGLSVLLPMPAFSQYTHNLNLWAIANDIISPNADLSINKNAILEKIKPNQWIILTSPNNPTGESIDAEFLEKVLTKAKQKNTRVFLDEAYKEFNPNAKLEVCFKKYPNIVRLRTFSKAYGLAGARVGYLIGSKKIISEFKSIAMPFNVSRMSLQLANLALENESEVKSYCAVINNNRNKIYQFLIDQEIKVFNGKGNFLLLQLPDIIKTMVSNYLTKNGIMIKTNLGGLENCIRITIPQNIEVLYALLQQVFTPDLFGFDMDGVLIDTSQSYDVCIQKTVHYFSRKTPSIHDIILLREKGGSNNDWELTKNLLSNLGYTIDLEKIIPVFQKYYLGNEDIKGLCNDEQLLLLKETWQNIKIDKAIITGRGSCEAQDGIVKLQIKPAVLISADDVTDQKPSPEGLIKTQNKIGLKKMWYFGDTVDDMQAGTDAGCVCIGIGDNASNLMSNGADVVLKNINDLTKLTNLSYEK